MYTRIGKLVKSFQGIYRIKKVNFNILVNDNTLLVYDFM